MGNSSHILDCSVVVFLLFPTKSQLQGPLGCATMKASSSVSQTGAVYRPPGSVTVTRTARTAATNTTPVRLAPVPPRSSAVTMGTVCCAAGFVMGTTTAGTGAMKGTVPRRRFDARACSGSVRATACASISPQFVTTLPTAPMVPTSLLSAVSRLYAFFRHPVTCSLSFRSTGLFYEVFLASKNSI